MFPLPMDVIRYIWSFDNTMHENYNSCLYEMVHKFNVTRINDRIRGEIYLYDIYNDKQYAPKYNSLNIIGHNVSLSKYILQKLKVFGDQVIQEHLVYMKLKPVSSKAKKIES